MKTEKIILISVTTLKVKTDHAYTKTMPATIKTYNTL